MSGTALDDALVALTALWSGLNIADLQVVDGPVYDTEIHFLAVGWDRSDQPAASSTADVLDLGSSSDLEKWDIACLLSLWNGSGDVPATRAAAVGIYTQLKRALAADITLGGAADNAWMTAADYTPDVGEAGDQVDLGFTVHVEAYPTD